MRTPEISPDGRKNYGFTVEYRVSRTQGWRSMHAWAPSKAEAIEQVRLARPYAAEIRCQNADPR